MPKEDQEEDSAVRRLIAKNISTLVPIAFGSHATPKGIAEIREKSGIPNGTVGRIVTPGAVSYSVALLDPLAKALRVQPWQLLLPDLSVTADGVVMSIEGMKARQWPFPTLRREEFEGLSPHETELLEKSIRNRIGELKDMRPAAPVGKKA